MNSLAPGAVPVEVGLTGVRLTQMDASWGYGEWIKWYTGYIEISEVSVLAQEILFWEFKGQAFSIFPIGIQCVTLVCASLLMAITVLFHFIGAAKDDVHVAIKLSI